MKAEAKKDINRILREDRRAIDEALKRGVREAMLRHKKDGLPVVVERHGRDRMGEARGPWLLASEFSCAIPSPWSRSSTAGVPTSSRVSGRVSPG